MAGPGPGPGPARPADPAAGTLPPAVPAPAAPAGPRPGGAELVEEDLLLEEISIDGMCGVY